MSSLLEQAIVDASALKEAALKNAEASVVEKYSDEVKKNLDRLLEQDELGLGGMGVDPMASAGPEADLDVPLGAAEGEELCPCPDEDESTEVVIDFDELAESLRALNEEAETTDDDAIEEEEEMEVDSIISAVMEELSQLEDVVEESGGAELAGSAAASIADKEDLESEEGEGSAGDSDDDPGSYAGAEAEKGASTSEAIETQSLVDAVMEKLTVDMGADLAGWAGRSAEDKKLAMERELAHRRSTDLQQELEDLKQAQEELVFENNQLTEKIQNYDNVVGQLKEAVLDVNLSNARLLYTNRVLRNTSLNERQKDKIVEAISKVGSVNEAKMIFETLQSTVQSRPKRRLETLGEAIKNPSSVIRATRATSDKQVDPIAERMKKLAGII
jgi:uncharacterized protein YoxC